ncbi:MAG: hypothetical protein ABSA11_10225 [Candidatus Bathyarchaeia archaeon]
MSIHKGSRTVIDLREKVEKQNNDMDIVIRSMTVRTDKLENELEEVRGQIKTDHDQFIQVLQSEQAKWIESIREMIVESRPLVPVEDLSEPVHVPVNFDLSQYQARQKKLAELLRDQAVNA